MIPNYQPDATCPNEACRAPRRQITYSKDRRKGKVFGYCSRCRRRWELKPTAFTRQRLLKRGY